MGGGGRAPTGRPRSRLPIVPFSHCGPAGGSDQRHRFSELQTCSLPHPNSAQDCLPAHPATLIWLSPQLQRP